ncbi:MAG: STAS domain-containing protein [Deltaproteobacteria bacterium]|nr:STAS domain-containing protein [Deltaproteobacteria bacterium]
MVIPEGFQRESRGVAFCKQRDDRLRKKEETERIMLKFDIPQRLDATNAKQTEDHLVRLIQMEKPDLLVCDFSATEYISSAGLRVMLVVAKKMKQAGATLELEGMIKTVADIFRMAGMHTILNIRG